MKINQYNYEQYFLDHAEGRLSPGMERELEGFLAANPDLRAVLENFDPSPVQPADIKNGELKSRLKKSIHLTGHITEANIDEWLTREMEGLLDEPETHELKEFLRLNPAYGYDQNLFRLTKLSPDLSITYGRKDNLKKKAVILPFTRLAWTLSAVAAVIVIFFSIRFFQNQETGIIKSVNTTEIVSAGDIPVPEPAKKENIPLTIPDNKAKNNTENITAISEPAESTRSSSFRMRQFETASVDYLFKASIEAKVFANAVIPSIPSAESKDKPLIAKVFSNMVAKAKDGIGNNSRMEKISKDDFSFWSIARAGIDGFNSISDREIELYVRKDDEGKVKSYALLDQDRLIWSKDLNKE